MNALDFDESRASGQAGPESRAGADAQMLSLQVATSPNDLPPLSSARLRLPSLYLLLLWFLAAVYWKTLCHLFLGIGIKMENRSNSNGGQMDQGLPEDMDPIWMSSRTARQIYAPGEVEKVSIAYCFSHIPAPTTRTRREHRTSHGCFLWLLPRSHFCPYPRQTAQRTRTSRKAQNARRSS